MGFQPAYRLLYLESLCVCEGAPGRYALQRLYSTFPGGGPGIGLLLLRVAVGLTATTDGVLYLLGSSNAFSSTWFLGTTLVASGVALASGFLTPIAGLLEWSSRPPRWPYSGREPFPSMDACSDVAKL